MRGPISTASPFITRVEVQNYRSIAVCDVGLGPLTVIVGPNAAGKSNFLDALQLVVDAVTAYSIEEAVTVRGGLDALIHRGSAEQTAPSFRIRLDLMQTSAHHPDSGARPSQASYVIEIGRDWEGQGAVLHESCKGTGIWSGLRFVRETKEDGTQEVSGIPKASGQLGDQLHIKRSQLLLPMLGQLSQSRKLAESIRAARFYDLRTPVLRALDETVPEVRGDMLGPSGEHLGHVLGLLAEQHPDVKETIDGYLATMVDNAVGVDRKMEGRYPTVSGRFRVGGSAFGREQIEVFERESLSEGTLRLAGVLTAIFQPRALTGDIPLVAIEEPEKAVHPPVLGALYEALVAASRTTQVMVATQSADLLDSEAADVSHILVANNEDGATKVGPLDEAGKSLVADKTMSLPELLRSGLMRPAEGPVTREDP